MRTYAAALLGVTISLGGMSCLAQQGTPTPNIGLTLPQPNSSGWQLLLNQNTQKLDLMLSGNMPVPGLNVTGNLTVGGVFSAPNLAFTPQQIQNALQFTPAKNDLSNVVNPAAALAALGGLPAFVPQTWLGSATYVLNQLAIGSDGVTYISTASGNSGNDPTSAGSSGSWSKFAGGSSFATAGSVGALQAAQDGTHLKAAGPQDVINTLGYTPVQPGSTPAFQTVTETALASAPCIGSDSNGKHISVPCGSGSTYTSVASSTVTPSGTINGTNKTFTLPQAVTKYQLYLNGLPLATSQYTASGNSFTLNAAPTVGADNVSDVLSAVLLTPQP